MSAEHRGAVFVFERTANPLAPLHSLRFPKAENDTFLQNNKDKFHLENDNVENYILFFPFSLLNSNSQVENMNYFGSPAILNLEYKIATYLDDETGQPTPLWLEKLSVVDQWCSIFYDDLKSEIFQNPEAPLSYAKSLQTLNGEFVKF